MDTLIAYCGLTCTECAGYIATQANDRAELERVAAMWREDFDAPEITVESVICDGCTVDGGRKCGHWAECEVRACAMERGVINCAHCTDYGCARIEGFFGFVPEARATLDRVRAGMAA
jgi:hypothetical protein